MLGCSSSCDKCQTRNRFRDLSAPLKQARKGPHALATPWSEAQSARKRKSGPRVAASHVANALQLQPPPLREDTYTIA